jgi:putative transposase
VTITVVDEAVRDGARLESACKEAGIHARTIQRWRRDPDGEDRRRGPVGRPGTALSPEEEEEIVELLASPEFVDLSPNQVVPKLADMSIYKASERTMYRVLKKRKLLAHRGRSRRRVGGRRPRERRATGPRQAWSWDITYLRTPVRGMFWMLYMVVDIWSRKIVAARVHDRESDQLSAALLEGAYHREGVKPGELWVHADNGGAMRGQTLLVKLRDLGATASFSRPHTSNDNPFSEALFRTMKYRPDYPDRPFATVEAAQAWVDAFVRWYNDDHQHSGIRFVTPSERHAGEDIAILENRRRVYQAARARAPRRWSRETRNWTPVAVVCLNPHVRPSRPAPAVLCATSGEERRAGQRRSAGEPASEPLTRPSTPRQSPSPTAAT